MWSGNFLRAIAEESLINQVQFGHSIGHSMAKTNEHVYTMLKPNETKLAKLCV